MAQQPGRQPMELMPPPRLRLVGGGVILSLWPLSKLIGPPIIFNSALPTGWKTALSVLCFIILPKCLIFAAACVLRKEGFTYLKERIARTVGSAVAPLAPARDVSSTRYRVGLALFTAPFVLEWALPYAEAVATQLTPAMLSLDWFSEISLLMSLFILGGAFWEKLVALFRPGARIAFPQSSDRRGAGERSIAEDLIKFAIIVASCHVLFFLAVVLLLGSFAAARAALWNWSRLLSFTPVLMFIALAAVTGRQGYEAVTRFGAAPNGRQVASAVTPARYRAGLIILFLPLLLEWLEPVLGPILPRYASAKDAYEAVAALLTLAGLFVLGGDFWDKLRGLFIQDAIVSPGDGAEATAPSPLAGC